MLVWIREPSELESPAEAFLSVGLGAALLPSEWLDSGCGAGPRVRWLADGSIEVEGEGIPTKALPKAVLQWRAQIQESAAKWGVPPQWVAGEMAAESGGQQNVHSYCCYGLLGLLPATASTQAGRTVSPAELLSDPALNIDLGTKLLGSLFKKYGGNPIRIPAAYNAGSPKCGAGKCGTPNKWNLVADCVNGAAVDYSGRVIAYSNAALAAGIGHGGVGGFAGTGWSWWQLGLGALAVGALGLAVFRPAVLRGAVGAFRENPVESGGRRLEERSEYPDVGIVTEWEPVQYLPEGIPSALRNPDTAKQWRELVRWLNADAKRRGDNTRYRSVESESAW